MDKDQVVPSIPQGYGTVTPWLISNLDLNKEE